MAWIFHRYGSGNSAGEYWFVLTSSLSLEEREKKKKKKGNADKEKLRLRIPPHPLKRPFLRDGV
jgi:hypothetical protein